MREAQERNRARDRRKTRERQKTSKRHCDTCRLCIYHKQQQPQQDDVQDHLLSPLRTNNNLTSSTTTTYEKPSFLRNPQLSYEKHENFTLSSSSTSTFNTTSKSASTIRRTARATSKLAKASKSMLLLPTSYYLLLPLIVVLSAISNLSANVAVASNMPTGNQPSPSASSAASLSPSGALSGAAVAPTAAITSQSSMSMSSLSSSSFSMPPNPMVSGNPRARYKTMYACEDRQLTMDCDAGSKINLIRANFGRFSITQCNEQGQLDLSTDCMSPITFRIMQDRCQDKQKCSVNATSVIFGDRCPKTRKYLEVHFQCQPMNGSSASPPPLVPPVTPSPGIEYVDVRTSPTVSGRPGPSSPTNSLNNVDNMTPMTTGGSSPILPPNNPSSSSSSSSSSSGRFSSHTSDGDRYNNQPQFSTTNSQSLPAPKTVINSEIMNYNLADNYSPFQTGDSGEPLARPFEPILVTMRHTHIDNMSNPRCFNWDQNGRQWTQTGSHLVMSNLTHTICAFDQATSYVLVMDYMGPLATISPQSNPNQSPTNYNNNQVGPLAQPAVTQPSQMPSFGAPIPGILDTQPKVLYRESQPPPQPLPPSSSSPALIVPPSNGQQPQLQQQQSTSSSSSTRFLSVFGYLLASVFVLIALMTIAFITSTMRSSSASQALKSFGNFSAFNYNKRAGNHHHHHPVSNRIDSAGTLHSNKDLLVINNQNGHQFLYAPASSTKISSSSSTHILSTGPQPGHHQTATLAHLKQQHFNQHQQQQQQHSNTLHNHLQQRMYSDNGVTLSNMSGAQSNNYYYGLMGLTSLFQHQQQQQQQQHFSPHHLGQQQQQQQVQQHASYNHQANKSTVSNESGGQSSSSSSGVESGSTSMQQHQNQATCLVAMNSNDYNLMGQQQQHLYGGQAFAAAPNSTNNNNNNFVHQQLQPTLTLNAHYSTSGGGLSNQLHNRQLSGNVNLRDHIYECVEDEKPSYMGHQHHLLAPMNSDEQQQQPQFATNTMGQMNQQQQHQQQVLANSRTMTLSSRLLQDANSNNNSKAANNCRPPFHQPAIVRDNQATKTNIICSKLAQVSPQRATEIVHSQSQSQSVAKPPSVGAHHDVMTIFNGNDSTTTTTTTTTTADADQNAFAFGARLDLNGGGHQAKLSTDC